MQGRGRDLSEPRPELILAVKGTETLRLDHFVLRSLGWKSRTRLQELIRLGRVTVNGERAKPSRRVRAGDVVSLRLSDGTGVPSDYAERKLDVLYEDPWLVAVNKPPGLLVHPVGRHVYDTLINYLHYRYRGAGGENEPIVPRLCHRIDRDTTGVVVVAKDSYVHRELVYQFENRLVTKEYLAVVEGRVAPDDWRIRIPLGEGRDLKSSLEHPTLKDAETRVITEQRFASYSLVRLLPRTGRQNQIRLHLAASGHPIAGDGRYGGSPPPATLPERFYLHSALLRFHHPRLKQAVELEAPLGADFRKLLELAAQLPGRPAFPAQRS